MKIKRFVSPPYMTNTYCLYEPEKGQGVLIDPTGDADTVERWSEDEGLEVLAAIFTHCHGDHFPKPSERWFFGFPWYAHPEAVEGFKTPSVNLSEVIYGESIAYKEIRSLEAENEFCVGPFCFKVIHTPGHTPGSACFLIGNVLFSGDTLFRESIGRTDFPTGSMKAMEKSLKLLMAELPDDTIVFPGHGDRTTIGYERKANPFIVR